MRKLSVVTFLFILLAGCSRQVDEYLPPTLSSDYAVYSANRFHNNHPHEEYDNFEQCVFIRINNERIAHGLEPLVWNDALADVARRHSSNMAQMRFFDFNCPDGISPFGRITNAGIPWRRTHTLIVRGNQLTPGSISLDKDVLFNEFLSHIGIGFYRSAESRYERYVTLEFISMPMRPSDEMIDIWELLVLELTNDYRASHGLSPLVWDGALAHAARLHSADMAYNNFMDHEGSDGSSVGERITRVGWTWRTVKENVAVGQSTPYIVVDGWINSPGHRANILSEDIVYLGVGFYFLEGSDFHYHWTQKFGAPLR